MKCEVHESQKVVKANIEVPVDEINLTEIPWNENQTAGKN